MATLRAARRTAAVTLLLAAAGCGLLRREPQLPDAAAVAAARAADAREWGWLAQVWEAAREDPRAGMRVGRALRARHPESARLAVLLQDLELRHGDAASVRQEALARHREEPTALHAYLAARAAPDAERRRALLAESLELDPEFTLARVARLADEARAGEPRILASLMRLIAREPGSAEAWRLLAELAPLFARPDLELRALQTEPWSPYDDGTAATLARARVALHQRRPLAALELVRDLPVELRAARLVRASALTEAGRYDAAEVELLQLVARDPDDGVAHFNLGVLYRERLARPMAARAHLRRYLELAGDGRDANLLRQVQAEYWLSDAAPPVVEELTLPRLPEARP